VDSSSLESHDFYILYAKESDTALSKQSAVTDPPDSSGPGLAASGGPTTTKRPHREALGFIAQYGVIIAFLASIAYFSIARPDSFPTVDNLRAILETAAPAMIVAVGLTVTLIMTDFDLSFGSIIALSGGVAVVLMGQHGASWIVATLVALGLCIAFGCLNGYLIAFLGGSSFIITLAMGTVITGVEFAFTKQSTLFGSAAPGYAEIAGGTILGIHNTVWIAAAIACFLAFFLAFTETGRYMYAVGGNPEASRLSGLRNRRLRLMGFVIIALCGGVVGILLTSTSAGSYTPNFGVSFLLPAYAAAFLGAAAFRGGQFNILGTVIGVLFLGVIQTGLTMLSLETYLINLAQGGILIAAVLISRIGQRS